MGYAYARSLAASHPDRFVVLASRNQLQGARAANKLKHATGNQHIEWMSLDLASLVSVRSFVREVIARDLPPLHAIVCNVLLPLMRPLFPDMSTPEAVAKGLAHLVLDPALEHTTGKYFEGMNERASSQESYDQHKAAELWEASAELVQLQPMQPSETILQVNSSLKER